MQTWSFILPLLLFGLACGLDLTVTGFLEVPEKSLKSFDWKSIEIYIANEENKIEEKAHPSDNGFYLIPVSHKKDYTLTIRSTKKDLQFSPSHFPLKLKNMDEGEILSKYNSVSFNFRLSGFSILQSIRFQGEKPGQRISSPEKQDIIVQLLSNKKIIAQTQTNDDGDFEFKDIVPGTYEVRVDDSSAKKLKFTSSSFTCTYSWEAGSSCDGQIMIGGTKLSRRLTLSGQPVKKGIFLIKSLEGADLKHCQEESRRQGLTIPSGFSCASRVSNSHGIFNDMPFGRYVVKLHFDNEHIKIEPAELKIAHPSDDSAETLNFQGFSEGQPGRALTPKGNGIAGVEIKFDGEKKYVTDSKGYFVMDRMKLGVYEIEATHPHYFFKPFTLDLNGESEKVLERIIADKIHLCGKVDFMQKGNEAPGSFIVNVQIEGTEGRHKRNTRANPDGTYCYEAPPGTYIVKATISQNDKILNIVPRQRTVTLDNEPSLGVDFSREKLSIKGNVQYLPGLPQSFLSETEVILLNSDKQQVKTLSLNTDTTFEFKDLFEEGYSVRINNPRLCFERDVLGADQSASKAEFVVKGIQATYKTDVPFKARIDGGGEVSFLPKKTTICFDKVGKIKLSIDDVFTFKNGMNRFEYDTSVENPNQLVFEVEKIKLRGTILVEASSLDRLEGLAAKLSQPGSITIKAASSDGTNIVGNVRKISESKYEYTLDTKLKADMAISLTLASKELSERLLISPKSFQLNLGQQTDTLDSLKPFTLSPGKLIKGKLTKELKQVRAQILRRLKADETFKPFQRLNITTKEFSLGPFDAAYDYDIKLEKKGFDFKLEKTKDKSGDIVFAVAIIEISQLSVRITTDKKEPLAGVSVYISSTERGNQFKTSVITGPKGHFTRNIHPGQYFVKSVLKEFEFEPSQSVIRIEDGQKQELLIKAKRTQFSASGSIKSFGSYSVSDLKVEATCEDKDNQLVESSLTDSNGNYLIKGLIPGKTYIVRVSNKNNAIMMPETLKIQVTPRDYKGLNFVLANEWSIKSLKGRVKLEGFSDG